MKNSFEAGNSMPGPEDTKDPVNNPEHYTYGGVECIDAMIETQGPDAVFYFCTCNAFKYLWRHRHKNGLEDVEKAEWYLKKAIELAETGIAVD